MVLAQADKQDLFGFSRGPTLSSALENPQLVNEFLAPLNSDALGEMTEIWLNASKDGNCSSWIGLDLFGHAHLQANTYLLDYSKAEDKYYARFLGQEIVDRTGLDVTGKCHEDMAQGAQLEQWIGVSDYCRLNEAVCTVAFDWSFIDKSYVKVWNAVFPLSSNGEITQLCGFYIWEA